MRLGRALVLNRGTTRKGFGKCVLLSLSLFYCPKHASRSKFWGWVGLDPIRSFLVLSLGAIPQTNQKGRGQQTSYQEAKVACEEDEEVGRYTSVMEKKVEM